MEILTVFIAACLGVALAQPTSRKGEFCAERLREACGTIYNQQCEYLKAIKERENYLDCLNDNGWPIYKARDYCADNFYNQTFKETNVMLYNACLNGEKKSVDYLCCLMTSEVNYKEQEQKEKKIKNKISGCDKVDVSRKCIMQVLRNESSHLFYN